MGNRYLQVMPIAAPAPVAPVAPVAPTYLQNQYGLLDGLFMNMPVAAPAPVAPVASVMGSPTMGYQTMGYLQELNLWNDMKKGAKGAFNSVHGSGSMDIAGVHLSASKLNNLDFVNPHDGITYPTYTPLQELNLWSDMKKGAKSAFNSVHGSGSMDIAGVHLSASKLQELNLFNDAIAAGKKEFKKLHFDEKVNVGGVNLHFKK